MLGKLALALLSIVGFAAIGFSSAFAVVGITLNIAPNVVLEYGGNLVPWTVGTYGNCYITSTFTNCLISNTTTGQFGGLILIGVIIIGFMLLAVMAATRRRRR